MKINEEKETIDSAGTSDICVHCGTELGSDKNWNGDKIVWYHREPGRGHKPEPARGVAVMTEESA